VTEADFFACQARLQAEARMALAQAKEMAHMQMEVERQQQKKSPITEMVRSSLEKVILHETRNGFV
jgi:vacuolar-type H+-ATPase subunit E/Vma4